VVDILKLQKFAKDQGFLIDAGYGKSRARPSAFRAWAMRRWNRWASFTRSWTPEWRNLRSGQGATANRSFSRSRVMRIPCSFVSLSMKWVAVEMTPSNFASFSATKEATSRRFLPSITTSRSYPPDIR